MNVKYKGQMLDFREGSPGPIKDYYNRPALWINEPDQRAMENMKFVGGFPDEWCIPLEDIVSDNQRALSPEEIRNASLELKFDFDSINAFPVVDCMDNDFIVYLKDEKRWAKLNIVDGAIFKKKDDLAEVIGGISE